MECEQSTINNANKTEIRGSDDSIRPCSNFPQCPRHFFEKVPWAKTHIAENSDSIKADSDKMNENKSESSPKFAQNMVTRPEINLVRLKETNDEKEIVISRPQEKNFPMPQGIRIVNFFSMLGKIVHFLRKIKQRIAYSDISNLTLLQLHIIGDYSHSTANKTSKKKTSQDDYRALLLRAKTMRLNSMQKPNSFLKSIGKIKKIGKYISMFHPLSKPLIAWKAFLCCLILLEIFSLCINLFYCLNWDADNTYIQPYKVLLRALLTIDVLVVLNTGILKSGAVIFNRREAVLNYIRKGLLQDLISLVVLFLPFFGHDFETTSVSTPGLLISYKNVFKFLFLLKLHQISKVYKYLEELLFHNEYYEGLLSLFKLFFQVLMISHLIACMWNFFGVIQTNNQKETWITRLFFDEEVHQVEWTIQYLYSWYFSLTTMITVGYGDITPRNKIEVLIASIAMLFGCGFFAYAISSIGVIVEKLSLKEKNLRKDLRVINKYMTKMSVDFELQVRIRKYLEHIWLIEEIENREMESVIMNRLSHTLREELLVQANGKVLAKFHLFNNFFSPETMEKVSQVVNTVRYSPDDVIIFEGEASNNLIYFIVKGAVDIFHVNPRNENHVNLKTLKAGDCFGQLSFFTEFERNFNAKCVDFCTLFTLKREDFLQIIKGNPEDFEYFHHIKDNFILYNDISKLGLTCESCSSKAHLTKECPFLRYGPNNSLIIQKHLHSEPTTERKMHTRRQRKSSSSLIIANYLRKFAQISHDDDEFEEGGELTDEATETKKRNQNIPAVNDVPLVGTLHLNESGDKEIERNQSFDANKFLKNQNNEVKLRSEEFVSFRNTSIEMVAKRAPSFLKRKNSLLIESQNLLLKNEQQEMFQNQKRISISCKRNLDKPSELDIRENTGTNKHPFSFQSHANLPFFDKPACLTFGGLNIDKISSFKNYYPYNNCKNVLDFNKKLAQKTLSVKTKFMHTNKSLIGAKGASKGLIEFRDQQRFFMKSKQQTMTYKHTKSKLSKRKSSVFRRATTMLFKNTLKG